VLAFVSTRRYRRDRQEKEVKKVFLICQVKNKASPHCHRRRRRCRRRLFCVFYVYFYLWKNMHCITIAKM
jgi:hypothetical protein